MSEAQAVEQVQEQIVPESDSGDWGDGALELEEQLLKNLESEDGAPDVKEDVPAKEEPASEPVADAPLFDLDGKLSLKSGQSLSAEHIKELERGWLREKDYTQKTQQLSEMRQAAENVLQASERINKDPRALREYFKDEQILSAFDKREMLNFGLSAAGVPPKVWNQFLEWYREAGYETGTSEVPTADPYVQQFGALEQKIGSLGKTVEQLIAERKEAEVRSQEAAQQQAYDKEMARIGSEVDNSLHKYPNVDRTELLLEMAKSDGSVPVEQLAKQVNDRYEARYNKWVDGKKQTKTTAPKPARGQSVNIVQRSPKTFDEADALIDQVYGTGALKSRG